MLWTRACFSLTLDGVREWRLLLYFQHRPFECCFRKFSSQATEKFPVFCLFSGIDFNQELCHGGEIGDLVNGSVEGFLCSCAILLVSSKCFTRAETSCNLCKLECIRMFISYR